MTTTVSEELLHIRSMSADELDEFFNEILTDVELREDLIDAAIALQAEAAGGETVTMEEYLAGKRTY